MQSEAAPESKGPTVGVPLALYDAMALCYYGGGPRHRNCRDITTPVNVPSPPVSEVQPGEFPGAIRIGPSVEVTPRGSMARRAPKDMLGG